MTNEENGQTADIDIYSEPIDPTNLLDEIAVTIKRFIICPEETVYAATLWIVMTWVVDSIDVAPLAVITAPEKRCGKSLLLFLMGKIVNRPLIASNITPAALFRTLDVWKPTMLIDETDAFLKENEELRGILNCGHTRDSAYVVRLVGRDFTPTKFSVFGPKALAGIGQLADTLMDRGIVLELRRKLPIEIVERLRHANPEIFSILKSKLARFAQDYSYSVKTARPILPEVLNDRAQDNWEPLFSIALVSGEKWSTLARKSAIKLTRQNDQSTNISIELLQDIHEIFSRKKIDRISSTFLITTLCDDDEKPWATYNRGFPITPRQIASRLKEFKITSNTIRISAVTAKGYMITQFTDAFTRYLPTDTLDETESQPSSYMENIVTDKLPVTDLNVTSNNEVTHKPPFYNACYDVTVITEETPK